MSEPNLLTETIVSAAAATAHLPKIDGKRPSANAAWRWMARGLSTPRGRIYLESVVVGRRLATSVEALTRFTRAVAEAHREGLAGNIEDQRPQYRPRRRTPLQRQRALERAEREAEKLGV
jgi:hypothetical protein